jgi:hypothetical protein
MSTLIATLCKQYEATPYADRLEAAEERAELAGKAAHRLWRCSYERARSNGEPVLTAIETADNELKKL